jgi:PAS domain S-box-containing protein
MKKRLFFIIIIIIFVTSAVIASIIGKLSYSFVKTVLRENREEKLYRIEKQLDHYQSILDSIEKKMDKAGNSALRIIAASYPSYQSVKNIPHQNLTLKAKSLGVGQIYFIDSSGIVFNSSLKTDINLNLFNVSNEFTAYLKSIYGKGEVVSQVISVSLNEGRINHYMYYSPKGSSMIYEISFDVPEFVNNKYNFALYEFLFSDMFKNFYNEYLQSIDIYSISRNAGWSLINSGRKKELSNDLINRIISGEEVVVESGNNIYVYKKVKRNRYIFNRTTVVYFELIYDISALNRYLKKVFFCSSFLIIIITVIAFYVSAGIINSFFITRIMNIIDGLKKIRFGDYDTVITDAGNDEISDIAVHINRMTETIKQRSDELNLTNEKLREFTSYVNDIIESMPSIIITLDENERIIEWNREAEKFTGYNSVEASGRILWDFIPSLKRYRSMCDDVRKKSVTIELLKEAFVIEKEESEEALIKNIFIFPFSRKDITGVIIRIDDITELVKNEEKLNRASRIEALGTMAGGLAHDFNNIITGIISAASYLNAAVLKDNIDKSELIQCLDVIKHSGKKASFLVKNLMSVSKDESSLFLKTDLNQVLEEVFVIAKSAIPGDIKVIFEKYDGECSITGNKSQIEQVILNLVINASEAIHSMQDVADGLITVAIKISKTVPEAASHISPPLCHICVSDNGPGIGPSDIKKIFDPFYTTKAEGNGLGLAVVQNIIMRHGGVIEACSELGKGTVFNIYLPSCS